MYVSVCIIYAKKFTFPLLSRSYNMDFHNVLSVTQTFQCSLGGATLGQWMWTRMWMWFPSYFWQNTAWEDWRADLAVHYHSTQNLKKYWLDCFNKSVFIQSNLSVTWSSMSILSSRYPRPPFCSREATSWTSLRRYSSNSVYPSQALRAALPLRVRWTEWRMSWYLKHRGDGINGCAFNLLLQDFYFGAVLDGLQFLIAISFSNENVATCFVSWPSVHSPEPPENADFRPVPPAQFGCHKWTCIQWQKNQNQQFCKKMKGMQRLMMEATFLP